MDLDELRAVQNKERQKDSLQHLRESFYGDVADYVAELEDQRDRAAEAADDPFGSPEVRQLTDEIETVREVAEAVYERRLGKLVKRASLAAADMPADAEGLTAEERELFDDVVDRIEDNKQRVLDVVEGGEEPAAGDRSDAATADGTPAVDAADVMGGDQNPGETGTDDRPVPPAERGEDRRAPDAAESPPGDRADGPPAGEPPRVTDGEPATPTEGGSAVDAGGDDGEGVAADGESAATDDEPTADHGTGPSADEPIGPGGLDGLDDRTTVRITDDVGEIFGVDDRDYDLSADDVVTLPAANAEPLLERDAAERIE